MTADEETRDSVRAVTREAMRREIEWRLHDGDVLFEGNWLPTGDVRTARNRSRALRAMRSVEALVVCAVLTLLGLGLMLLANAVI